MKPALHLTTKVLPGNKIEIEIPEGEIGILLMSSLFYQKKLNLKSDLY